MISERCLVFKNMSVREAGKGFLVSLEVANPSSGYVKVMEITLALLATFAEGQGWPDVSGIAASHIKEYLHYFARRKRRFGAHESRKPISQSYLQTQHRRLNRFFGWLEERGYVEEKSNPLRLIPRPKLEQKVIPTVSNQDVRTLLASVNPDLVNTYHHKFRAVRDHAMLYLLADTAGRRAELTGLRVDAVDLDLGRILLMGKGRRER